LDRKTSSDPEVTVTPQGTIRVPQTTKDIGYHVRHERHRTVTVEKEIFRA